MKKKNFSEMTNEELKIKKKELFKRKAFNAVGIGFLAGIFFVGIAASIYGRNAFAVIPMLMLLFIIYKLVKNSKKEKELEDLLKERGLN